MDMALKSYLFDKNQCMNKVYTLRINSANRLIFAHVNSNNLGTALYLFALEYSNIYCKLSVSVEYKNFVDKYL